MPILKDLFVHILLDYFPAIVPSELDLDAQAVTIVPLFGSSVERSRLALNQCNKRSRKSEDIGRMRLKLGKSLANLLTNQGFPGSGPALSQGRSLGHCSRSDLEPRNSILTTTLLGGYQQWKVYLQSVLSQVFQCGSFIVCIPQLNHVQPLECLDA